MSLNGKSTVISKDRTKTKSSYRTLPLVKPFEDLLYRLKSQQAENRKLCGNAYCKKYADYIYVNELRERIKPNYITQHFPMVLEKHGMRKIRFHDLRHPYVKYTTKINLRRQNLRQSYTGLPEISLAFLTENTFIQWFEAQSIQNPFPPSL